MLTPPGPTRRPTTITTLPATTEPRSRLTMPAITRIAAMIHRIVAVAPPCARIMAVISITSRLAGAGAGHPPDQRRKPYPQPPGRKRCPRPRMMSGHAHRPSEPAGTRGRDCRFDRAGRRVRDALGRPDLPGRLRTAAVAPAELPDRSARPRPRPGGAAARGPAGDRRRDRRARGGAGLAGDRGPVRVGSGHRRRGGDPGGMLPSHVGVAPASPAGPPAGGRVRRGRRGDGAAPVDQGRAGAGPPETSRAIRGRSPGPAPPDQAGDSDRARRGSGPGRPPPGDGERRGYVHDRGVGPERRLPAPRAHLEGDPLR